MAKTIYDVAREAGVAVSTVSRAMNNSGYVSENTRKKIKAAMRGYQPDAAAQRLVTKISRTIAVMSAMMPQYFFVESNYAKTLAGITDCAKKLNHGIMLDIGGNGSNCIELHRKKLIDGVILIDPGIDDLLITQILNGNVPVVLIGSPHQNLPGLTLVDVDRVRGFYDGVNYLVSLGHRKIAMINGQGKRTPSINKRLGFEKAMRENDIPIRPEYMLECEETNVVAGSYVLAKQLLRQKERPTAIFAYADISAMGVYQAAKELGLNIPKDLSVIGFDDVASSQYCEPKLSSVAQPIYNKGYIGVQHLVDLIQRTQQSGNREGMHTLLSCSLVIRDSACPPPR